MFSSQVLLPKVGNKVNQISKCHAKKSASNKMKKNARKREKPVTNRFGNYCRASISPRMTGTSQKEDQSETDEIDKENVKKNKFFKSRRPRKSYPVRKESAEGLLMKDRKLLMNKKQELSPRLSVSLSSLLNLSTDSTFDNNEIGEGRPTPPLQVVNLKRKSLPNLSKRVCQSPKYKSDSPRLNKLRSKLNDNTSTRDMLNRLFDAEFLDGSTKSTVSPLTGKPLHINGMKALNVSDSNTN